MYRDGTGVPQDYKHAVKWDRLAAGQGNARAQFNLGASYNNGEGIPQDYVQAHMWLNLAGASGHKSASESRDKTGKRMTGEQIAEAQRLASMRYLKRHHLPPFGESSR